MNNTLVRAIRGPIVLITLGVLLAFDHMGSYGISRTWPVSLIMIGVMKLLERAFGSGPVQPQGGNQS